MNNKKMKVKNQTDNTRKVIIPKVTLFFDHILTTAFRHTVTASGVLLAGKSGIAPVYSDQIVVVAGPNAGVKVGDKVEIAPERFAVKFKAPAHDVGSDIKEVQVPLERIDGIEYMFLSTRELKWIYDKEEK